MKINENINVKENGECFFDSIGLQILERFPKIEYFLRKIFLDLNRNNISIYLRKYLIQKKFISDLCQRTDFLFTDSDYNQVSMESWISHMQNRSSYADEKVLILFAFISEVPLYIYDKKTKTLRLIYFNKGKIIDKHNILNINHRYFFLVFYNGYDHYTAGVIT